MADLSELDRRILDLLGTYESGAGAWPRLRTLAERLGVSRRHVRRRLATLEAGGYVVRQPTRERGDDPGWTVRGQATRQPGRQTSNLYRIEKSRQCPRPLGHAENETPSTTPRTSVESCPPLKPRTTSKPVGGTTPGFDHGTTTDVLGVDGSEVEGASRCQDQTWPAYADSRYYAGPGRRAPAAERPYAPTPIELQVPERDQLDHQPKDADEILGILRAGLGEVEVLDVWRHPTYATARGRVVNLETCSTSDMHRALDQLDRDTCWGGPCPKGCRSRCIPRCLPDGRRRCHRHRRHNGGAK